MGKRVLTLWKGISTAAVLVVVILTILLVGVRLFGYDVYYVLSSSMVPTYETGELLYVKETDPKDIEKGTPITFALNTNTVVTHRVIEVINREEDPGTRYFRTKGDANNMADGTLISEDNVLGVPKYSIPKLGYLAFYIQNPPGRYIAIAVAAFILFFTFLPDVLGEGQNKKRGDLKG